MDSISIILCSRYDENEMPIVKPKSKRIKHRFHIDIRRSDINQDLGIRTDNAFQETR